MAETEVPWPWPGDTDLDKARHIAREYRDELRRVAPDQCARMDAAARRLGQGWVAPAIATMHLEACYRAGPLADYIGVRVGTIYQWASRGHITRLRDRHGHPVYLLREVVDHHTSLRERRIERQAD